MSEPLPLGEMVVYEAPDGVVRVDVRLERDTVWLTQAQMAELFGRERSVVTKHVRNVFREGELELAAVCANFAHTAADGKTYQVEHYNLDVIISVGYRVKSPRDTQFRIWATRTLREHLLRGYTLHERRLAERGFTELEQAIALLGQTLSHHGLIADEGRAVLDVVQRYSRTWRLLLAYDEDRLAEKPSHPTAPHARLTLADARSAVEELRRDLKESGAAGSLFGQECGEALSNASPTWCSERATKALKRATSIYSSSTSIRSSVSCALSALPSKERTRPLPSTKVCKCTGRRQMRWTLRSVA